LSIWREPRLHWKMRPYGLLAPKRCCGCAICRNAPKVTRAAQKRWDARVVEEQVEADWALRLEQVLMAGMDRAQRVMCRSAEA
jgi:hypothetical protein